SPAALAQGKVTRMRMWKIASPHRCGRKHREVFGDRHSDSLPFEEIEQRRLHRVIWTRRISRRRTNAAIFLANQRRVIKTLVRRVAPQLPANPHMQPLGERLREPAR